MASAALILINRDMIYEFNCEHCNGNFEVNLPMADCQKPISEPCPLCSKSGKIYRVFQPVSFQSEMINNFQKKAGNEWKDTLRRIDSKAGSMSEIRKGHI